MNEAEAISRMIAPGQRRPGKYMQGIIQVWVTRNCDRNCTHCTQGSNFCSDPKVGQKFITLEQFEQAVSTLRDYWGVVGVFGGNPALHPEFLHLCTLLKTYLPKKRRGIWCNNPITPDNTALMRDTFSSVHSNINVHQDTKSAQMFKEHWPEVRIVGEHEDSLHSPVFCSMRELIPVEHERWDYIIRCDINRHWSPMVGVFRGELRAWFCEIAGAQSILNQSNPEYPDTGLPVTQGWWKKPIGYWADQIRHHCHRCAVPLRGKGIPANESNADRVTCEYVTPCRPIPSRYIRIVYTLQDVEPGQRPFIKYMP